MSAKGRKALRKGPVGVGRRTHEASLRCILKTFRDARVLSRPIRACQPSYFRKRRPAASRHLIETFSWKFAILVVAKRHDNLRYILLACSSATRIQSMRAMTIAEKQRRIIARARACACCNVASEFSWDLHGMHVTTRAHTYIYLRVCAS